MNVSVVIPAYNEEKRITKTIDEIKSIFEKNGIKYEIIVVDDGSTDKTVEVCKEAGVKVLRHEKNMGKGAAVKTGFMNAENDIIGFVDADGATYPESILKIIKNIGDYDIVIGSRRVKGSVIVIRQPIFRLIASRIFNIYVNFLFNLKIKDTQCGCKFMKAEVAKTLASEIKSNGFEFDVELLARAKRKNLKILEFPVKWKHIGGSKFNFKRSFDMFIYLFKLKIKFL
jgi:dolichyl-phosphate beta-glucosyltransferase